MFGQSPFQCFCWVRLEPMTRKNLRPKILQFLPESLSVDVLARPHGPVKKFHNSRVLDRPCFPDHNLILEIWGPRQALPKPRSRGLAQASPCVKL